MDVTIVEVVVSVGSLGELVLVLDVQGGVVIGHHVVLLLVLQVLPAVPILAMDTLLLQRIVLVVLHKVHEGPVLSVGLFTPLVDIFNELPLNEDVLRIILLVHLRDSGPNVL
mmetsp:Transcript_26768/g.25792  ORF Transcript_26768/g.25792 Transcript_26768/m.25792 type:complete len:112 (-) Transcript_26768:374-709(-)